MGTVGATSRVEPSPFGKDQTLAFGAIILFVRRLILGGVIKCREHAVSMRCRRSGQARAAFWRALGFPNLALARATLAAKRALAKQRLEHPKFRVGKHLKLD
jgi:hypothetical protein